MPTPRQVIDQFASLKVKLDPPAAAVPAPVRRYASANREHGTGHVERARLWDRVRPLFAAERDPLGLTAGQARWAFFGAALPDEVVRVLRLLVRWGVYDHAGPARRGLLGAGAAAALARVTGGPPVYVGLDCTGLTWVWAHLNGLPAGSRDRPAIAWVDGGAALRTEARQVLQSDVVCWANGRHVCMIEGCGPAHGGAVPVRLVEAGGLGLCEYAGRLVRRADDPPTGGAHPIHFRLGGRAVRPWFKLVGTHHSARGGDPWVYVGGLRRR